MFSKPGSSTRRSSAKPVSVSVPLDAPSSRKSNTVASMIGRELTIVGDISGDGELHLDGAVKGDVRVDRLTVGESGSIEGAVIAETVECRGRIAGSVTAAQVRLYGAAEVEGDLTHEQLTIETGASFLGRSLRLNREPAHEAIADVISLESAVG